MSMIHRKSKIRIMVWVPIVLIPIILFYLNINKEISVNEDLLKPKIALPDSVFTSELTPNELNLMIKSIQEPSLVPKGLDVPEFSAEQQRPSRYFIDLSVPISDEMLNEKYYGSKSLFEKRNVDFLNCAYAKTGDPKYLTFALKKSEALPELSNREGLYISEMLKSQRLALLNVDSTNYLKVVNKLKKLIVNQINTKSPLTAIEILRLANNLPLTDFKKEVLNKLQPVLMKAMSNINESRQGGLFLTSDESTQFSEQLIYVAWDYRLNQLDMPAWLFELAEKEACRLAYRLEQDGCLPSWTNGEKRINRNEIIYKAALIFNRDDLRYIAFNGFRSPNAYSPEQTDFEFKELGLFIFRSGWNHAPVENVFQPFRKEELQVTFDKSLGMISVSLGSITQLVFHTTREINSLEELKSCFNFKYKQERQVCNCVGYVCDYTIEPKDIDLILFKVSQPYILEANSVIKSYHLFWPLSNDESYKDTFLINLELDENKDIKEIRLNSRRK